MAALLIGYARVSTDQQDLTAQREGTGSEASCSVNGRRVLTPCTARQASGGNRHLKFHETQDNLRPRPAPALPPGSR